MTRPKDPSGFATDMLVRQLRGRVKSDTRTLELTRAIAGRLYTAEHRLNALSLERSVSEKSSRRRGRTMADGDVTLEDDERERIRACASELEDVELLSALLTLQKVVETRSTGTVRGLAESMSTVLSVTLGRFAPVTFGAALDAWEDALTLDAWLGGDDV